MPGTVRRHCHLSFVAAAAAAAAELHPDKNIFVWLFFLQISAAAPDGFAGSREVLVAPVRLFLSTHFNF